MTVEEGIEVIETGQYCEREDITIVVLPKSVRHIGDYAFAGCKNLTHIELQEGVTEIGECAFADCKSLKMIDIPQSTRLIGTEAFANCSELRQVTLPQLFDSLSPTLFLGCPKLENIAIGDIYETDGQFIWSKEGKELIIALPSKRDTQLTIPEGITEIKTNALALNSHINRLTLPSSLDRIDGDSITGMRHLCEIITKEGSKFHSQNGLLTRDDVLVLCPPSHRNKNITTSPHQITTILSYHIITPPPYHYIVSPHHHITSPHPCVCGGGVDALTRPHTHPAGGGL